LLIQYGHNDEKEKGEAVGAFTTYKADLKKFVAAARQKGATPILITPVQRRTFDQQGRITNSHGDYPEAVRQVAREENVALIDLHSMSTHFYEALGPERSKLAFKEADGTHHNNYGSYELAKCVVEGIREAKLEIAKHLIDDFKGFDPSRPDPVEAFSLPASPVLIIPSPWETDRAAARNLDRTSREGRFTPAHCQSHTSLFGTSGGKPPFLTCSI
jgi:hypothetical protein